MSYPNQKRATAALWALLFGALLAAQPRQDLAIFFPVTDYAKDSGWHPLAKTLPECKAIAAELFAAGRGATPRGTAVWWIVASQTPAFATATSAFALPGQSNPLVLLPSVRGKGRIAYVPPNPVRRFDRAVFLTCLAWCRTGFGSTTEGTCQIKSFVCWEKAV